MNRRRNNSIAANPILIGGVTVLVTIVAVFLSYNANHGLPFVPTYKVNVVLPDAAGLIAGNEVRIGGARVGIVRKIDAIARKDGSTGARLELALDDTSNHLPVDSTVKVRPKSSLGLKYVQITRGSAARTIAADGTLTVPRGTVRPIDLDDFFNMYDEPTRQGSSDNLLAYGTAFAGRGGDLNQALGDLDPLVRHAEPALRNLVAPKTRFEDLFPAFEQAAHEVAPVAGVQAQLFGDLNTTFKAFADNQQALEDSIAGGPHALDVATRELPAEAGFLQDSTELFRRLKAPFRSLASASVHLAPAFRAGTPALKISPRLNARLVATLDALDTFVGDPRVLPALQRLTETATLAGPLVSFLTPAQTTCNYATLLFRNLGSALSEGDDVGTFLRTVPVVAGQLPNSEAGPSSAPANGPADSTFKPPPTIRDTYLHSDPYPNTAAPGQTQECESGLDKYVPGQQVIGTQPGDQGTDVDKTTRGKVG
ncbi:MAG: Mammalian cell entry related domain protein [Conexibacter sp.]|nr:Mammalian cell entry related domain protein [Conexibacter sp.]